MRLHFRNFFLIPPADVPQHLFRFPPNSRRISRAPDPSSASWFTTSSWIILRGGAVATWSAPLPVGRPCGERGRFERKRIERFQIGVVSRSRCTTLPASSSHIVCSTPRSTTLCMLWKLIIRERQTGMHHKIERYVQIASNLIYFEPDHWSMHL